jgi:hypothetical protein
MHPEKGTGTNEVPHGEGKWTIVYTTHFRGRIWSFAEKLVRRVGVPVL